MAIAHSTTPYASKTVSLLGLSTPVKATRYAIIGEYAKDQPTGFVRHAALLKESMEITTQIEVGVWHIGPPIVAGLQGSKEARCRVDVLGDISLSIAECEAVADFLASVEKENRSAVRRFQQYTIIPHMKWTVSEEGRRVRRRFSCTGFVIEAYREAGVELIDTDHLPLAEESILKAIYSELEQIEAAEEAFQRRIGFLGRGDLGIHGPGPWAIALPGYIFHSTARLADGEKRPERYQPTTVKEAYFPLPQ